MDLISVIVPVYNVEGYLRRCVDSILAQTYENLEIILVDDGATDLSGAICDEYAARDARIRVIHKPNGGLSSARNAGIDIASGDYLAFVDSDDWIDPEMYSYLMGLIHKYDVKLAYTGRFDVEEATGERTVGLCPEREEKIPAQELVKRIFLWDNVDSAAWDKLYHRSLFARYRYPEGKICEDVPVTYRLILETDYVAVGNKPMYHYYHRAGSITKSKVSEKSFHFSQHTAAVYEDIRKNYPELAPRARYLRVRSLSHILLLLETEGERSWEIYPEEYSAARGELRKHLSFLLTSPLLGKQERLTDLLLILGWYRPLRRLYHGETRKETKA